MKLGDPLDCAQNELRNAVLQNLAAAPSAPVLGQVYTNTSAKVVYAWNGTAWRPLDAAALTDGSIPNAALTTNPLARANHTGTQPSSTISDLATVVKAYTLDQFAQPIVSMNFGTQRLTNIAQATNITDAPRWDQVQAYVAAAVQGQTAIKNPARLVAAGNLALSGLGVVDGVQTVAGDRVLAVGQTTATQNGLYVAAAGAWTLASDAASGAQWVEGTEILVAEGTAYAGAIFRQTTAGTIVLGTTALAFTQAFKINSYQADGTTLTLTGFTFAVSYGYGLTTTSGKLAVDATKIPGKYATTITCDGVSSSFTVTHNLNATDVIVGLRDSTGNKVFADDNPANANAVTVSFGAVPANGTTYRVTVHG